MRPDAGDHETSRRDTRRRRDGRGGGEGGLGRGGLTCLNLGSVSEFVLLCPNGGKKKRARQSVR